jgi:hypothetical protein
MTEDRQIMVAESFLTAIEDVLRESADRLRTARDTAAFHNDCNKFISTAIAAHVASDLEVIESIKMVREASK